MPSTPTFDFVPTRYREVVLTRCHWKARSQKALFVDTVLVAGAGAHAIATKKVKMKTPFENSSPNPYYLPPCTRSSVG